MEEERGGQAKKKPWRSWRYASVVKNTYYSYTGSEFAQNIIFSTVVKKITTS